MLSCHPATISAAAAAQICGNPWALVLPYPMALLSPATQGSEPCGCGEHRKRIR